jgi:hypothetical protein
VVQARQVLFAVARPATSHESRCSIADFTGRYLLRRATEQQPVGRIIYLDHTGGMLASAGLMRVDLGQSSNPTALFISSHMLAA